MSKLRVDLSSIVGRWNKTEDLKAKGKNKAKNYSKLPVKGQTIKGQIMDVQLNKVSVLLEDGQLVEAKMAEQFEFVVGDQLSFHVKESNQDMLLLQPLLEGDESEARVLDILKASGFKGTPENVEIVKKLIDNNMPINKKMLTEVLMYSKRFPEAKIDNILFLIKYDIIVSKDSLHYVTELLDNKQSISTNISSFNSEVANIVDKESGALVAKTILKDNEPATIVFTKVRNSFLKTSEQVYVPKEKLGFPINKVMSDIDAKALIDDTSLRSKLFGETIKATPSASVENFMANKGKAIGDLFTTIEEMNIPDDIKLATNKLFAKRITKSMLNNELMMNKEDFNSVEKINKHYNKVYDRIIDVLNLDIQDASKSVQEVLKEASNIKTNVEIMNQLQENHQFIHIPIVLNDQNIDSELYIMNNKKSSKSKNKKVTALLRLDLRNLGQLDIYVVKTSKNVEVNFYVEGDETIDHIRTNSSTLVNQLVEKSFNVLGIGVMMKEKKFDIVSDFLDKRDNNESKRFSFDMKA